LAWSEQGKEVQPFQRKRKTAIIMVQLFWVYCFVLKFGRIFFVFNFVGGFLSSSLCPSSHSLLLTNASPLPFVRSFASTFLCFTLSMGVYRIRCTPIYSTFSTLS
jgi:hypothetical protein